MNLLVAVGLILYIILATCIWWQCIDRKLGIVHYPELSILAWFAITMSSLTTIALSFLIVLLALKNKTTVQDEIEDIIDFFYHVVEKPK